MDTREAEQLLSDEDVIPLMQGAIPYIKQLVAKCLDDDIPAIAGCPPGAGKG